MKQFFLGCLCMVLANIAFAQTSSGIKKLLRPDGSFTMTKSLKKAMSTFKLPYTFKEDTVMISSHVWEANAGLMLTATVNDSKEELRDLFISAKNKTVIKDLPFGMILHKTTKAEAVKLLKQYKIKKTESLLYFNYNGWNYYFQFDSENDNRLDKISITAYDLLTAG
jgi:hypothetical protein